MKNENTKFRPYRLEDLLKMDIKNFKQLMWLTEKFWTAIFIKKTSVEEVPYADPEIDFNTKYFTDTGIRSFDAALEIESLMSDLVERGYLGAYSFSTPPGYHQSGKEACSMYCGTDEEVNEDGFKKLRRDVRNVVIIRKAEIDPKTAEPVHKTVSPNKIKRKRSLPAIQPPLPHATTWERLHMIVNELFTVYVFYADEEGHEGNGMKIDFESLGMKARDKTKPGALWWEFQELAIKKGNYSYTVSNQGKRRKNKEKLTSLLQQRFELSDDPFDKIGSMLYKTKFSIEYQDGFPHDLRGAHLDTGMIEEHLYTGGSDEDE